MSTSPSADALFRPTDEHDEVRAAVRALVQKKVVPRAAEIDSSAQFPFDVLQVLVDSGYHATHVPEEFGGPGADALATCIVIEEVARGCVSTSLIPAVNKLGSLPLMLAGSPELQAAYLPRLAAGEGMFSYALSEPEAGSDAGSMRTTAVQDGDDWVLHGTKRWISNAGVSEFYTVMAVTDAELTTRGGITAFVVEKSDPGVSFGAPERKLGIKGSPTCEVYLDHVRIPDSRRIGPVGTGFQTAMRTLDHTRVTIGAQAVGVAQGALDYAAAYAQERRQFGRPVSDFQGMQFLLADMAIRLEESRERLGLETLPMVYLHDPENTTWDESMADDGPVAALVEARESGLIGHLGVSGGPVAMLARYLETGLFEALITHNRYSLVDRSADALLTLAAGLGVGVLNASPYGGGLLTRWPVQSRWYAYGQAPPALVAAADRIGAIAHAHGIPFAALALHWSLRDPRITSTIVGMRDVSDLRATEELLAIAVPDSVWPEVAEVPLDRTTWQDPA